MKLLRYTDLVERGVVTNRTTLARWIAEGRFPKPIRLGPNSIAWREEVIDEFIAERAGEKEENGNG